MPKVIHVLRSGWFFVSLCSFVCLSVCVLLFDLYVVDSVSTCMAVRLSVSIYMCLSLSAGLFLGMRPFNGQCVFLSLALFLCFSHSLYVSLFPSVVVPAFFSPSFTHVLSSASTKAAEAAAAASDAWRCTIRLCLYLNHVLYNIIRRAKYIDSLRRVQISSTFKL